RSPRDHSRSRGLCRSWRRPPPGQLEGGAAHTRDRGYIDGMFTNDNRERRRATFQGGVARSAAELRRQELEAWQHVSPEDRLTASLELVETYLSMGAGRGVEHRLDRTASGVRRR